MRKITVIIIAFAMLCTVLLASCDGTSENPEQTGVKTEDSATVAEDTSSGTNEGTSGSNVDETSNGTDEEYSGATDNQDEEQSTEEKTTEEQTMKDQITEEQTTEEKTTEEQTTEMESETVDVTDVTFTENGNRVTVSSAGGLKYDATGYVSFADSKFTVNKDFVITVKSPVTEEETFNRIKLRYTSDKPLKLTAIYEQDGNEITDLLYLEAGKTEFNFLIKGYIDGQTATKLKSIQISTCEGTNAKFMLYDLDAENVIDTEKSVYYIENEYYKLGIRLAWGGGICYLNDKTNTISGVRNLINQADEGRLVQQSYYGTFGNSEYTPGNYNGSKWAYNPVQGGDQYRNSSRLIDIQTGEGYVYIKSQPQDWSLNGQITPSYMENKYMLDGNVVRVDNRFVDFSGWEHRYASQELPAFYTISWLDTFYCYLGSDSWKDGALTVKDSLNFWGDPAYHNDCVFKMPASNTETWCAWVNPKYNYGIGLYVPNVDQLLAGRYSYNGSKNSNDGATNYVAPLNTLKIVSYESIEYSYLITTGSVEEIRSVFKENKDFAKNESLHNNYISGRVPDAKYDFTNFDFSDPQNSGLLMANNNTIISYSNEEKALKLSVTGDDVQTTLDFAFSGTPISADVYKTIKITYMIPNDNQNGGYGCELFLCTGSVVNATAGKSVNGALIKDGQYHTLTFDLSGLNFWKGNVNNIRFDYFNGASVGDVMYLKSIVIS